MEDCVKFAIAKGIKKYGFSSHAPLPFLTMWTMKEDDFFDYNSEFNRIKEKYQDKIELYLGLEVDYIGDYSNVENKFFKGKNLDYIISSIHYVDKIPNGRFWNIDGEFSVFENGVKKIFDGDINAAVNRFFELSKKMIALGSFDIVGHLDKIAHNARAYKEFSITDKHYIQQVEETLFFAKQHNKIVEINTKAFNQQGYTFPQKQHFDFICDQKIPIHVNSDSHYPTNVADSFRPVYKQLKEANIKTMHQLFSGKWQEVPFDENGIISI
jgi:histidinol-phosphatase (PHP family)